MTDYKLIIWDFDGVIADSEKIWLEIRLKQLNETFHLDWHFNKLMETIGGTSDKTSKERLSALGIQTDDAFWNKIWKEDEKAMSLLKAESGVKDIIFHQEIKQCIATGGYARRTRLKLQNVGLSAYFPPKKVFTADMVEHGKPEPYLFLLAAKKMGERPEDCVVIEDSLAGMKAGIKAGMETVAYIGCEMNQTPGYIEKIKALGIRHIFRQMADLQKWLGLS